MLKKQALTFVVVLGYCRKKTNSRVEDMEFPRDEEADRTEY